MRDNDSRRNAMISDKETVQGLDTCDNHMRDSLHDNDMINESNLPAQFNGTKICIGSVSVMHLLMITDEFI